MSRYRDRQLDQKCMLFVKLKSQIYISVSRLKAYFTVNSSSSMVIQMLIKHRMSTVVDISALRVKHRMATAVDISALGDNRLIDVSLASKMLKNKVSQLITHPDEKYFIFKKNIGGISNFIA